VIEILVWVMIGITIGLVLAWLGTGIRIWSLETKFRGLANEVYEYTLLSNSETLPAEWVQERLDTFIRKEFRG
jgi:hypothetical protein